MFIFQLFSLAVNQSKIKEEEVKPRMNVGLIVNNFLEFYFRTLEEMKKNFLWRKANEMKKKL